MSLPDKLKSPNKLERSIHNQLQRSPKSTLYHHISSSSCDDLNHGLSLSLRKIDLVRVLALPTTLLHIKPQAEIITSLDLSYSITDDNTIETFCRCVPYLEHLKAVNCGLEDISVTTPWPKGLKTINLSRNRLKSCPRGISLSLFLLVELNLSGNRINSFDPSILRLPCLEKIFLLKNPIANVPKHVCRLGVFELRKFFEVEPIAQSSTPSNVHNHKPKTMHNVFKAHQNLKRYLLKPQGSLDSGYDSESSRRPSCSSSISLNNDAESMDIEIQSSVWTHFTPSCLPQGYTCSTKTRHCQVYLPDECTANITIEIVKDISFQPFLKANNEYLITPVVRVTPHGLVFRHDKPAIIVLSHCTKPNEYLKVTPLCSNTSHYQPPNWINLQTKCEAFNDCIMFETTHFSLFSVIGVIPYPTASVEIEQKEGGTLFLPEIPGLKIYIPPNSLHTNAIITATAYYSDPPYGIELNDRAIASSCLELKPHHIHFLSPIEVSLPIPDYLAIKNEFPDAQLQLWHSSSTQDTPNGWEHFGNQIITIHKNAADCIATFTTTHFSFFELLWTICKYPLTQLGLGASYVFSTLSERERYISVRCQAFMSRPLKDMSFGLVVIVYKFGEPILELSNYPWLVTDSGSKRVFLKIGQLFVSLMGCFDVRKGFGETLSRCHRLIEYNGEDFCLRFEFALRFDEGVQLPLPDGQILGKVRFIQWIGSNSVNYDYNIIKPPEVRKLESQNSPNLKHPSATQSTYYNNADFTPPWSPDSDMHLESDSSFQSIGPPMSITDTTVTTNSTTTPPVVVATTPPVVENQRKRPCSISTNYLSTQVKRQLFIRRNDISDQILMNISHKASHKYLELGLELGLDNSTIQNCVSGGNSNKLKAFYMFQEWKARAADEFTFSKLSQALEQVGLTSIAQEFCYTC